MESSRLRIPLLAAFVVLVVLCVAPARLMAKEYTIQSWKTGYGLEASGLACCLVGSDGTVWMGAIGDLIRFDGLKFDRVPFDLERYSHGDRITALWEDAEHRIWCGCETGEVIEYDSRSGHARILPIKWSRQAVRALHADPTGDLWLILDDHSLVRVRDGWTSGPKSLGGGLRFLELKSGALMAERAGGVYEWQPGGSWKPVFESQGYLSCAFASPRGGLWLVNPHSEVMFRFQEDGAVLEQRNIPKMFQTSKMFESVAGDLIGATDSLGIFCIGADNSIKTYTTGDGLVALWVLQMAEDPSGNVMVLAFEGVSVLRQKKAERVKGLEKLDGVRILGVSEGSDGGLWIGTGGTGALQWKGGVFKQYAGMPNLNVWSILDAGSEGVLFGSWGGGLERYKDGRYEHEKGWEWPKYNVVTAVMRSSDGAIWVGTNDGVGKKAHGEWTWFNRSGETQLGDVRYLFQATDGRIWFGTNGHGAGYIEDATAKLLDPEAQTGSQFVTALHDDGAGGVWIGTEGAGLINWRGGRWGRIGEEDGLPSNNVFHIDEDKRGMLWFTSSVGAYAVPRQELEDVLSRTKKRVSPLTVNREDGLPSDQCAGGSLNAAFLSPDGLYYVPTSGGLSVIDTNKVRREDVVLHPSIVRTHVDGRQRAASEGRLLVSPPRTRSIRVEFTAPTLGHPSQVEFAYRLDGEGRRGWINLGQSRSLVLQRMSPGSHRLEIRAKVPGSPRVGPPAYLDIEQQPTLVETLWFRGLLGLVSLALLVLVIWIAVRRRYVRERRRLELEAAVEKERRRIARDIHDELGAHLVQVMQFSQVSERKVDAGDRNSLLSRIHSKTSEATRALDELVWAVNPSHDSVEGYALYVSRLTQEMVSAAGLRCRIWIPETIPPIPLESGARHHLLMCMKEAVANAIKHSACTQIDVRLEIADGKLRLSVTDDGRGFAVPESESEAGEDVNHSGCRNMRARMSELNGRCEMESSPGKGTRVVFEFPL